MTPTTTYYGINKESGQDRYDAIVDSRFNDIAPHRRQPIDGKLEASTTAGAEKYLLDAGMTEEDRPAREKLCGK